MEIAPAMAGARGSTSRPEIPLRANAPHSSFLNGDRKSVPPLAEIVTAAEPGLNILVNNAGAAYAHPLLLRVA